MASTRSDISATPAGPAYRPDIDGLRAIAVLAVVAYHAAPAHAPGGFAGVDVFFVVSGFLITTLLLHDARDGELSIARFFARRVRRIFPALVLVLAASVLFGWYILLPREFEDLCRHAAAAALFVVNFVFWREANYFDPIMASSPLLHLWSLAVEEQFYLLWPVIIALTVAARGRLLAIASSLCVASFALNIAFVARHGAATFFLLHTRWWELMAGGLLAYRLSSIAAKEPTDTVRPRVAAREVMCVAGIIAIGVAFVFVDRGRHYPGGWALLPVIGTCCVIAAGPECELNRRLLSHRWLVYIGLISYPLYLWHWPALTFVHIVEGKRESLREIAVALGVAVFLAVATFHLIEKPIRRRGTKVAIPLLAGMLIVGTFAWAGAHDVLPLRSRSPQLQRFDDAARDWDYPGRAFRSMRAPNGLALWSVGQGPRTILVYGDSNAEQYGPRIERLVQDHPESMTVMFATTGSCPPVFTDVSTRCAEFARKAIEVAHLPEVTAVVLAGEWAGYVDHRPEPSGGEALYIGKRRYEAALTEFADVTQALKAAGKDVYVILNIPAGDELDPRYVLHRRWSGGFDLRDRGIDRKAWEQRNAPVLEALAGAAMRSGAVVIDPVAQLCGAAVCKAVDADGEPIYRDGFHLRASFVRERVHYLDAIVQSRPR